MTDTRIQLLISISAFVLLVISTYLALLFRAVISILPAADMLVDFAAVVGAGDGGGSGFLVGADVGIAAFTDTVRSFSM